MSKIINNRKSSGQFWNLSGQFQKIKIPNDVKKQAQIGLDLLKAGFSGGTQTGWNRAKQLTGNYVDIKTLADMRTWFARHGPDAYTGGTSYPGYLKWINNGSPKYGADNMDKYRGAVAWLIWGGDAAYLWLKQQQIRNILAITYPNRKISTPGINII